MENGELEEVSSSQVLNSKRKGNVKLPIYLLNSDKHEGVINYPVIKINFLTPSFSFENIDYLLFTSKNGVRAINRLTEKWKRVPSIAIGEVTANEIKKLGGYVSYFSKSGYGEVLAKEIDSLYLGKNILWIRAKKVITDIKKLIKNNFLKELVVYETSCNIPNVKFTSPAIVIFSSPSTVRCFFKVVNNRDIIAYSIGKKSFDELINYIDLSKIKMCKERNIKKCIDQIKDEI